jgi:outer membrane protein assembly factor BamD
MAMTYRTALLTTLGLIACGGGPGSGTAVAPAPIGVVATQAEVDSLWTVGVQNFRAGHWEDAAAAFERLLLEFRPGDPRIPEGRFFLGECYLATKSHLQAVREFRKVADETPNHALAPEALLRAADAYSDLWRRAELDPTYGQTALATYQELTSRYPESSAAARARAKINVLNEKFAEKEWQAAEYYLRRKAYDSAILYLKNLVANYPATSVAERALLRLVRAYRRLGYTEDAEETCVALRRFHPDASGLPEVCPDSVPATAGR